MAGFSASAWARRPWWFWSSFRQRDAEAGVFFAAGPNYPQDVKVGQTGIPAQFTISNTSDGTQATGTVTLNEITLLPACSNFDPNCTGGTADPGVFQLSATGVGAPLADDPLDASTLNDEACPSSLNFNLNVVNVGTGKVEIRRADAASVTLGAPGSLTQKCRIAFTFSVLRMPTIDSFPGTAGAQVNGAGFASGTHQDTTIGTGSGSDFTTVALGAPAMVTQASEGVPVGGSIFDRATLSGGGGPTGTITFTLFGPDNATCSGQPIFTSPIAVTSGNGTYQSASFQANQAGTYRWIAAYGGDANNSAVTTACNDPNEQVVVGVQPTASPTPTSTPTPAPSLTPARAASLTPTGPTGDYSAGERIAAAGAVGVLLVGLIMIGLKGRRRRASGI